MYNYWTDLKREKETLNKQQQEKNEHALKIKRKSS